MMAVAFRHIILVLMLAGFGLAGVTAQAESSAKSFNASAGVSKSKALTSTKKKSATTTNTTKKKKKVVKKSNKKVTAAKTKSKNTAAKRKASLPSNLPLSLESNAVFVMNERTGNVLYAKNADTPRPIASITKLMTAMVVLDAKLPMDQTITVSSEEIDRLRNTTSRLQVGSKLTRREMMLLALMSSENRAAAALARSYPGGTQEFVKKMNAKARALGMKSARFYDATGLHGGNVATPRDLAKLVQAANAYPEIRQLSTWPEKTVSVGRGRQLAYNNSNALVKNSSWNIGIQKTGFINEAGRCLVMQADIRHQPTVIVLLDSQGKYSRIGDANRVKQWLETGAGSKLLLASK
jgi:D-alanyl-D-alanine endopeptidase (penicillin-binding protein 7)